MTALLTDLYQLTMLQAYLHRGMVESAPAAFPVEISGRLRTLAREVDVATS
ncbi:MAG: hypothetical protein IT532_17610 [Burkholderiales bacterium]|nr:hypothetical protein [Burkholderiales bacterium]